VEQQAGLTTSDRKGEKKDATMFLHYYAAQLRKEAEARRAQPSQPSSLRDRFVSWYGSLPAVSRDRRFAMSELEVALKTQGKYISPALLDLGWRRKRVWSTTRQYHRYWEPPTRAD
jgi:hypothetical protein